MLKAFWNAWSRESYRIVPVDEISSEAARKRFVSDANQLLDEGFGKGRHSVDFHESPCLAKLPCSLLLLFHSSGGDEKDTVVGHVRLRRDDSLIFDRAKALRMLGAGLPEASVRHAASRAGFDLDSVLNDDDDIEPTDSRCTVVIEALVVAPQFRGRGLGHALAKAAVIVALQLGAADISALAASKELLEWYKRLGALRDTGSVVGKRARLHHRKLVVPVADLQGHSMDELLKEFEIPDNISITLSKGNKRVE